MFTTPHDQQAVWMELLEPRLLMSDTPGLLRGDANGDGKVDWTDYGIVINHLGQSGQAWGTGDFNGDGKVDMTDMTLWQNSLGRSPTSFLYGLAAGDKIRAAWVNPAQTDLVPLFKAAGFNTIVAKWDVSPTITPYQAKVIGKIAAAARANGMSFVLVLNLWGSDSTAYPQYRPFVRPDGTVRTNVPDLMDPGLWRDYLGPRIAAAAALNPDAVLLDMELYKSDPDVDYESSSFSDVDVAAFAATRGLSAAGPAALRALVAGQYSQDYYVYQRDIIAGYARALRASIASTVALGSCQLDRSYFRSLHVPAYDGLAIGLGTQALPALSFSESLYYGYAITQGWQDYISGAAAAFQQMGANVLSSYGVQVAAFAPGPFAVHARDYAAASSGYWLFSAEQFNPAWFPRGAPGPLADYLRNLVQTYPADQQLMPVAMPDISGRISSTTPGASCVASDVARGTATRSQASPAPAPAQGAYLAPEAYGAPVLDLAQAPPAPVDTGVWDGLPGWADQAYWLSLLGRSADSLAAASGQGQVLAGLPGLVPLL